MTLWMVRAGKRGEQEQFALDNNLITIGWNELPDLSSIKQREELKKLYNKIYSNRKLRAISNEVTQVWAFLSKIQIGDLVALPLKTQSAIAIGKVTGPYEYHEEEFGDYIHHIRKVEWIRKDIPRTDFDQDILYSLGAFMTVCQIRRNNAEARVKAMLTGKTVHRRKDAEQLDIQDIEEISRDQILKYINEKFRGHDLQRLVDAVVQAQGYITEVSSPGPDGGVDILAGSGPLGFDPPRICIQVKSSSSPVDVNVFRSLQGTMKSFNAEQGLLVSWGGFKRSVLNEARRSFFSVRLWDSGDLLGQILKYYEEFPDYLKAELPLKRVWSIVPEE